VSRVIVKSRSEPVDVGRRPPREALPMAVRLSLSNLVLLYRRHHRLVHDRFTVEMIDGRPRFLRPDGEPMEGRAPP
jgi:hypothetical protein